MRLTADTLRPMEAESPRFPSSRDAEGATELNFSNGRNGIKGSPQKHILVVDDEQAVRELVVLTVARAGFRADTALDGEEGWNALCLTSYDLVITDHEMPRLTGLDMIKRLRAVSVEPPCILISGNLPESESTLQGIVHPGVILAKPFSCAALIETVYSLLMRGDFQES